MSKEFRGKPASIQLTIRFQDSFFSLSFILIVCSTRYQSDPTSNALCIHSPMLTRLFGLMHTPISVLFDPVSNLIVEYGCLFLFLVNVLLSSHQYLSLEASFLVFVW